MKRLILACTALVSPILAQAQTVQDGFVVPSDVLATTGVYVEKFNGYAAGSTENQIGDGTARGGTAPVIATMPADIPSVASGWLTTGSSFETVVDPATEEVKARFVANRSRDSFDDPIRNSRQPGTSHCHTFFGNTTTNAYSTYASLRTQANLLAAQSKPASTAAGGPYNATAYWHPCIIKPNAFGDGKNYVVRAAFYTIYYVENPATPAAQAMRIPRGMRYVLGVNMDDPDDTIIKAQIATANAQSGTAGRYAYPAAPFGNGWIGYRCLSADQNTLIPYTVEGGGNNYPAFKTAGGADPWGGNCNAGKWLVAEFNGPNCYDGTNIWSPGGYKHFRRKITDNVGTASTKGCPNGWFYLPAISLTMFFKHQGFADYGTWYLSSDAMATTKRQLLTPGADPMRPGESMHTDWMNGWDDTTLMKWHNFCFGQSGGSLHICANGTIGSNETMLGGAGGNAPDGSRSPQITIDLATAPTTLLRSDMTQVPASLTGPHVIHAH